MMALLTYGKDDPGWSHNSKIDDVQNFGGPAGSYSADILFMVLGYFAYIFPLLLAIKAYQIFRQRHEPWQWSGKSEEHTSELQSLMRISYAVSCLKQKKSSNLQTKKLKPQSNTN